MTLAPEATHALERIDGYAAIRDYAAVGDGRTVALIARDGSVDWLPLPDLDSPTVFAAILDATRGGHFVLEPEAPYSVERRYVSGTNVLETTFETAGGAARVTDALTLPGADLGPGRELVRRVDWEHGTVPFHWRVEPRFCFGAQPFSLEHRTDVPVAAAGGDAIAVCTWDAGEPLIADGVVSGRFEASEGRSPLLVLAATHEEPLVFPARGEVEARLEGTIETWRAWARNRRYTGPHREAVMRSLLALKLLVFAPSGAIAAAATTSLPEEIGGVRNWDYRFSWVRDSTFTLEAFLALGCTRETRAYFWWLMHATQLSHPRLQVLYRLDGGEDAPETTLPLEGHRRSAPVRVGNAATAQLQLDTYGELLQAAWLYARVDAPLDADFARRLSQLADFVAEIWRQPDFGIWEVRSEPVHFTQSKMMCWVALDRALDLAARGIIPGRRAGHWREQAAQIRQFVETRCWSEQKRSYVRFAGSEELDASLLLAVVHGYADARDDRLQATIDAVREELGDGPFLRRYSGDDGVAGSEGAFLACSFWLVEALARSGRLEEATALLDELVALANDVGLYAEEVDPATGAFLGNIPQGLSHLGLITAAVAIDEEEHR